MHTLTHILLLEFVECSQEKNRDLVYTKEEGGATARVTLGACD